MATSQINLPPGFELDEPKASGLPAGFQIESPVVAPSSGPSKTESFMRGVAQGTTFGAEDELTGLSQVTGLGKALRESGGNPLVLSVAAPAEAMKKAVSEYILKNRGAGDVMSDYRAARDAERAQNTAAQKENPWSYGTGQFAGAVTTAPLMPAAAPAKGLAAIGNAAKTGAVLGGASGLGSSEADLTKGDLGLAAKDVAIGAGTGAVIGGGVQSVVNAVKSLPGFVDTMAQRFGKSAIGATKRFLNTDNKAESIDDAVRLLREKGVFSPAATMEELSSRVENINQSAGQGIGDFLKGQSKSLNVEDMIQSLEKMRPRTASGAVLNGGVYAQQNAAIDTAIDSLSAHGSEPIDFATANAIKSKLQDAINYGTDANSQNATKAVAARVKDSIDEQLANVSGEGPEYEQFLADKKAYGSTMAALRALRNRVSSQEGNRIVGVTDWSMIGGGGAAALALHNPMVALETGAAFIGKKAAEKYGPSFGAWSADKISTMLANTPEAFGKYGPQLAAAAARGASHLATSMFILQQQEPEFSTMLNNMQEEEKNK